MCRKYVQYFAKYSPNVPNIMPKSQIFASHCHYNKTSLTELNDILMKTLLNVVEQSTNWIREKVAEVLLPTVQW